MKQDDKQEMTHMSDSETSGQSEDWQVNLAVFEGPLDLLLHLINKLEIDIYDIPIAQITKQYLSYIHSSNVMALDSGGDYLVMAATLMSIKSQMLVPRNESFDGEDFSDYYDGEDPRDHLMSLLIEYRRFTQVAGLLSEKENSRIDYLSKPANDLSDYDQTSELEPGAVTLYDLQSAFSRVLHDRALREPVKTKIHHREVSVSDKIQEILSAVQDQKTISFQTLFSRQAKYELVTGFLALLELIKLNKIRVKQGSINDDITIIDNNG